MNQFISEICYVIEQKEKTTIKIPLKPYLKRYFDNSPFLRGICKLSLTDPIGIILINLLRPAPKYYRPQKITGEFIEVDISGYLTWKRPRIYLDDDSQHQFNLYLERLLKHEFFTYVDNSLVYNVNITAAINDFMSKYDLNPEEIAFETLKKSYYRYRKYRERVGN